MRIAIDAIYYGEQAGGAKHVIELLKGFKKAKKKTFYIFVSHQTFSVFNISDHENFRFILIPFIHLKPILGVFFSIFLLPVLSRIYLIDKLFLPFNSIVLSKWWYGVETISMVRDLAEYFIENKYDRLRMFYRKKIMMPFTMNNSSKLIFISQSTYRDAKEILCYNKNNYRIIHHGKSNEFKYTCDIDCLTRYKIEKNKYFLTVGRLDPIGKNLLNSLRAFETYINHTKNLEFKYLLVGAKWRNSDKLFNHLETYPYRENIILTEYVTKSELITLYSNALALIFPSLYEGFGHPILEAMSCMCPVLCSNSSSLPEISGDAALLFNPHDVNDISVNLEKIDNEEIRNKLITKGINNVKRFSWNKCAKETLDYIIE